jgi:putative transposase
MKLNKTKILEILKLYNRGWSSYSIRKRVGVTEQRVNQIIKIYRETGIAPVLRRPGRPPRHITKNERKIVKEAYATFRTSACFLEPIIKKTYDLHLPHNLIHKILLEEGLANKGETFMPRKKNWIRYERRHSLTAVHLDWHKRPNEGCWVHIVEDDASRAILSLIECESPTVEKTIEAMEEALQYGFIREAISDHGAQYTSNRGDGSGSRYKQFLDKKGTKQILCRIKHPQSNGKVEKLFHLYERHRDAFASKEEFVHWYNHVRPHLSLDFSRLETPWQAFERKKRKE